MKINFLIIAAIATATIFASCSRNSDWDDPENGGAPTTMNFSFTFSNSPQTRATGDPNATDDESKINTVDVLVYHTATGAFSSHQNIPGDKFIYKGSSGNMDLYMCNEKIATTTGEKSVFVGINLPENMVNGLMNQPVSALGSVVQSMTCTELAGKENFAMFSVQAWKGKFEKDESFNTVVVTCQRLVAKLTVETAKGLKPTGDPGELKNMEFTVANFNKKQFLFLEAPYQDPNWAKHSYSPLDFDAVSNAGYAPVTIGDQVSGTPQLSHFTPRYAAENSSEGKLKKEITRVLVRAGFIPMEITEISAGNFSVNDRHSVVEPQTFYSVASLSQLVTSYFFDENVAKAYRDKFGGEIVEYTDGICYWDIFVGKNPKNPANKWDVLRNNYYKCKITGITTPGRNKPDITDPEVTPEETETNITADVQILFWTLSEDDYDLF